MGRRRLIAQLLPALLVVSLLALLAAGWFVSDALRNAFYAQVRAGLEAQARLIAGQLPRGPALARPDELQALCRTLASRAGARVTIISPTGHVLADSHQAPGSMDNHADRPEFIAALGGQAGSAVRYSFTLGRNMQYVAVPVYEEGRLAAVVRCAVSVEHIDHTLAALRNRMLLGGQAVLVLLAIAGVFLLRRLTRPLEEMRQAAARFAGGELDYRVPPQELAEAQALAETMGDMAVHLDEQIRTLTEQRNQQETLLAGMVEGVIAVDTDQRVITINPAAGKLFGVDPAHVQRRSLQEAIRNAALHRFVAQALAGEALAEGEIAVREGGERLLEAHGTVLRDADGTRLGALIVLNDVTGLRRLESLRRDFVANVSHELKTPITSIKGFVETLRDGALRRPDDAERFLEIIAKQADRLDAIINDLLTLSRIEQEAERAEIALEESSVREVLEAAIQDCQAKAEERQIAIGLSCPDDLRALVNRPLLEQAAVNLIDNAIKYSDPGSPVAVEATGERDRVVIRVRDRGPGIDPEHLPRLFERFYRVDKARSRKLGGTGLGLAIVKHIVQAHGGRVTVESTRGSGSVFSIDLPPAPP